MRRLFARLILWAITPELDRREHAAMTRAGNNLTMQVRLPETSFPSDTFTVTPLRPRKTARY